MERKQIIIHPEQAHIREQWRYVSAGGVYAAEPLSEGKLLLGGTVWDRRHSEFNPTNRAAPGIITLLDSDANSWRKEKEIVFPSMVNVIIPLGENIFVGLKRGEQACNLLNQNLEVLQSGDDKLGDGIYNATFHEQSQSIVVATRNGWLLSLDPETFSTKAALKLTKRKSGATEETRLWSLTVDKDGSIISGDYSGKLFVTDPSLEQTSTYDMRTLVDPAMPDVQKVEQPAVFGVTTNERGQVVSTIRWGQINWFDRDGTSLSLSDVMVIPEEISQIATLPGSNNLLIGTRSGKLLYYQDNQRREKSISELLHLTPAFQHDNSIWSISCHEQTAYICFADGQVVSIDIDSLK